MIFFMFSRTFCCAVLASLFTLKALWPCFDPIDLSYPSASSSLEFRIDSLLEQGEQYFIAKDFSKAEENLSEAISLCRNFGEQDIRLFRGLLDRSLVNACLGFEDLSIRDLRDLETSIDIFHCGYGSGSSKEEYYAGGKPILGEDQITIAECIERAETTISYFKDLLTIAPVSFKWQTTFLSSLHLLELKAKECCRSGGVWKACLEPLLNKWVEFKIWESECRRSGHWYLLD